MADAADQIKRLPETPVDISMEFVQSETKLAEKKSVVYDKVKKEKFIMVTPSGYPETNTKDLKIGNLKEDKDYMAVHANAQAVEAIRYYGEKTGKDLTKVAWFIWGKVLRRMAITASIQGDLLHTLHEYKIINESTERLFQNNMEEQSKKKGWLPFGG
jgi:hypothetical protein